MRGYRHPADIGKIAARINIRSIGAEGDHGQRSAATNARSQWSPFGAVPIRDIHGRQSARSCESAANAKGVWRCLQNGVNVSTESVC